jgi:hypothetical protein
LYEPDSFGGHGGSGGGAVSDWICGGTGKDDGGIGGGIIQMYVSDEITLNGALLCEAGDAGGARAGGAAGGSILIHTGSFRGHGSMMARGGAVPDYNSTCYGGGGSGGRITIHYATKYYLGTVQAHGGSSRLECGGAGTILWHDTVNDINKVVVLNQDSCHALHNEIDYSTLDDYHRGSESYHTWLFDPSVDGHHHHFHEVELGKNAELALWRRNIDTFRQTVNIEKTLGDKSGNFHVGPMQVRTCAFSTLVSRKYIIGIQARIFQSGPFEIMLKGQCCIIFERLIF